MKKHSNLPRILLFASIFVVANFFINTGIVTGQTVFNNNHIRIGNGSENSINTNGNMQQPFYYNSVYATWRQLTFSTYPLDNSFAIGGDGTNEWNLNGTMVYKPTMISQVIDLSGYVVTTSPNGYGTIVSTGTINVGGSDLEIKNTYELGEDKSFIKITTKVKNISGAPVTNVRYWVGTRDDFVGASDYSSGTDDPLKEKGNLVDGSFVKISNATDRALALRISSADEGILFYTNSSKGNNIINSCCSWSNVTSTNPQNSVIEVTNDGSYGFYVRMNDLANGESDEFEWYYAASKLSELEDVVEDVAAASGAISDITYTTATFKAKTTTAGTGYWMVVPRNSTAPTALQIKSGANYGSVVVTASGSSAMSANVDKFFYLTGLSAGTDWDLYFVSEDATPAFSSIAKVQFTTQAYTVPALSTVSASSITLISASSGGNVTNDGGQSVTAYGICWNTSGTPTISDSKTNDGSGTGTFTSSLTGLTEGTTYYVRAYATNSVGTAYGNQITFATLSTSISGSTGGTAVAPNTLVYIAQAATIQGTTLVGASVSIYNNYLSDQDVLGIDGATSGTVGSIDYSFNSSTGILTMEGSANASEYQALIRKITYSNTKTTPNTSSRSIKISLNAALAFDGNGHYYEFVTSTGITWANAKTAASGMKYFGLQGYLVTLTSVEESTFVISKLLGQGWLGASDEASEGTWKWVSGPENGNTLSYTNWNSGEPNDAGSNEDCAQFLDNGLWNDLSSTTTLTGYVVEYGGMVGDPTLDISDNVSVTINIPSTTAATSVTATSFNANWSYFAGSTDIFLDVATDNSFTNIVTGYSNKELGNIPSTSVTGLNPNTTYYYRVRITVPAGTSFYSSITSATTLKREQTISFSALDDMTYGDSNFDLTATASSILPVSYSSSNTSVATVSGNTVHIVGAGNTTFTASQAGNTEYYAATNVLQSLKVDKAILTVTADEQTKTYGNNNPALTFQYLGFVNGDDANDLTTKPNASTVIDVATSVGEYVDAITVAGGDDENYAFSYVSNDFSVTKATLTATADAQTKFYGDANPTLTFQYAGFVNGDDSEDLATEPATATAIDAATVVGEYDNAITVAGGTDENYAFAYVSNDFSVTKATLTVTADAQTKVYGDANPAITFQYAGFVNGDDSEDLTTVPATSTSIDAASVVGEYDDAISVAGGDDENYAFTYISNDFSVTKATLTVTADAQTKFYGDANPTLTFQYAGFVNGDDAEDLTTAPATATAIDAATVVGEYDDAISVAGGDDENYAFAYVSNDFSVTKATLTVTADPQTKVYGDTNPTLTFQYAGFVNGDDEVDLATVPATTTAIDATTVVGEYEDAITVAGGDDENYAFAYVSNDFSVTKATLTATADMQTKVYGDVNPTLTFQYAGFVNGDDAGDLATLPATATSIDATTVVGEYDNAITVAGGDDENYAFAYVSNDFSVTKATITVTADAQTKVYGDANPTLTFQYAGFVNDDDVEDLATAPYTATSVDVTTSVGVHDNAITVAGGDDENYTFAYVGNDFTVTKATLTVTADSQTKVYGDTNPILTFQYAGFVNGDNAGDLSTVPATSTAIDATTVVGEYEDAITVAGGTDDNYAFAYVNNDFSVTKATLTVTADPQTKVYGDANPTLTFQYAGFVNGDDEVVLSTVPATSTAIDATTVVGEYEDAITVAGGDDENYAFAYVSNDFSVTKAMLTATADAQTKVYGDANPTLTFQYAGFVNGDDAGDLATVPVTSTAIDAITVVGEYNDAITVAGGADENYAFAYVSNDFSVTKATLTARAENKTRVYLESNPEFTIEFSGFVNSDGLSDIDVLPVAGSEVDENSDAGIYDINVSGGSDTNYMFAYENGTITIDKADQVITFSEIPEGLRMTEEYQFDAEATSGLSISYESSDSGIGSINGDVLSIITDGAFTVTATQDGNHNWNPAEPVTRSVSALASFDNIMSLFTPNNDGINDYWYISDMEDYGNISVSIYNRFGNKVYETRSYNNDWDGIWNGKQLPSASYYYIIKSEKRGTINGVVNIVR